MPVDMLKKSRMKHQGVDERREVASSKTTFYSVENFCVNYNFLIKKLACQINFRVK